jgi:DNA-binding NtrC family response regulator
LFFRISTIPITVPALRDRRDDIPIIAEHLVAQLQADIGRSTLSLTPDAYDALRKYAWPGNIRELRNVLERAALLAKSGVVSSADLRFQLATPDAQRWSNRQRSSTLNEVQIQHIKDALEKERGLVPEAAKRLGIPKSSLYAKIKQYGIARRPDA